MGRYENPAVVIGGGVNGLGVIRNLGRNGVDVYCVVDKKDEAVYSKYCKRYFVFPGVERDLQKLKIFLTRFKHQHVGKVVLFPTSDISALNVSSLIGEMGNYLASVSDREVLETLVKKRKFYRSLITRKVPHPVTLFPDTPEVFRNVGKEISFPVFVKPSMSQVFYRSFGQKGFVANSEKEVYKYLLLANEYQIDVMIQEIVPGPATNHYFIDGYFDKNCKSIALFARRRLRMFPLSFGNSTACVSVPISEVVDMKATIVRYLSSIGFRGIFSAEFKRDPRDNVAKLLEVNARSWWYNSFPSTCGVNIILMAYLEAIGKETNPVESYEINKNMVYFFSDLRWALAMFVQRKFSLREWLSPLIGESDRTVFASDDLKPFLMSILSATANISDQKKFARMIAKKHS